MTHVTYRLAAEYRNQLRNPMLGNRVRATYLYVQTMLELARLQLVTGDLESCQSLCDMMLKNDQHKDTATATVVRTT